VQIAELKIENFRGIREGVVRFSPHTVLGSVENQDSTGGLVVIQA
jgi:putative ATP-dependent endonuclease of OLD family